MKKYYPYAMLLMSVFLFTACPSDDDDDEGGSSGGSNKALVGYWNISTLKYSMVLFDNGIMKGVPYTDKSTGSIIQANWQYDEDTRILATSAINSGNNLQWHITMLNEDNWTGIALWNDKNTTYAAQNTLDAKEITLLLDGKWVNDAGETITFSPVSESYNQYDGKLMYINYSATEKAQIDLDNEQRKGCRVKFNRFKQTSDQINLGYFDRDNDTDYYQGKTIEEGYYIIIINPYSFKNRRLQVNMYHSSYRDGKIVQDYRFDGMNYHIQN